MPHESRGFTCTIHDGASGPANLVYAVFGGFLALRRLAWLWPHLASTTWCVTVTLTGVRCPLTALERWLLELGGRAAYADSFTAHYLRGVLYPAQYEMAVWVSGIAVAVLSYVLVLVARLNRAQGPAVV